MDAKTRMYLLVGGGALVLYTLIGKKSAPVAAAAAPASPGAVPGKLPLAAVNANEPVTAGTYRIITARRPGLSYVPVTGSIGSVLSFASPKQGMFTRNVLQENSALYAEVA